jgi:hypothetical protein
MIMDKREYLEKVASAAFNDELEKLGFPGGGALKAIGESYKALGSAAKRVVNETRHTEPNMLKTLGQSKWQLVGKDLKKGALAGGLSVAGAGGLAAGGMAIRSHLNKKEHGGPHGGSHV